MDESNSTIPEEVAPSAEPEEVLDWLAERRANQVKIPRTKQFSRQQVANAFSDAFELIGGTTRLAQWAHHNPDKFFPLFAKLLPQQAQQPFSSPQVTINVHPALRAQKGETIEDAIISRSIEDDKEG